MNKYPAKVMMDEMATHGRYGDTMLVHMNPVEVAGLASLSPTGKLTTNPVTGQPEAFLPLLAPALGILGGALKLGTLGTAALTGIGTAAVTGDLKRGLISGLTAGAAGGIADMFAGGAQAGIETATTGLDAAGIASEAGLQSASALPEGFNAAAEITQATSQLPPGFDPASAFTDLPGLSQAGQVASDTRSLLPGDLGAADIKYSDMLPDISPMQSTMLTGIGASTLAEMDVQDDLEAQRLQNERESYEKRMQAYNDLQAAYGAAQPGVASGLSPMRAGMSNLLPQPYVPTMGAASGGYIKRMAEGGETSPLVVEPTEEEARVLALARQGALSPQDQMILEQYYSRRNQQMVENQQAEEAAAAAEAGIVDGVLRIPPGTTNSEALNILLRAGMIRQEDYNWFNSHFNATGSGDSQYLASDSFPGIDEYLGQNQFNDENRAKVRRVLGALDQAQTDGIREEDLNYLTDGAITNFGTFGGIGNNPGYGGIDPISIQAGLRGAHSVAPPPDYMTGFEPEFSYFQDDPNNIAVPTRMYRPTQGGIESQGDYFDPILDKEAYLEQLRDYYRRLANYTPDEVYYPEEEDSIEDDEDNQGEDDNNDDDDDVIYPPVDGPEEPEFNPVFERGISLVTGKRWKDMSESEKIAHAYMRGESDWYGDKEGSPAWDEAMAYIDNKFGDRVEDYKTAYRNEAIERAMAGNAGFSVEDMLRNAGYANLDQYMQSDTSALQRELLGDRDYHSRNEDYTMPDPQEAAAKAAGAPQGSPKANSFMRRASQGKLKKKEIEDFRARVAEVLSQKPGSLTFGGESSVNSDDSVSSGGVVFHGASGKGTVQGGYEDEEKANTQKGGITSVVDPSGLAFSGSPEHFQFVPSSGKKAPQKSTGRKPRFTEEQAQDFRARMRAALSGDKERLTFAEGGMAEADMVTLRTPLGQEKIQGGGIANVPTPMNANMPTEQEFAMVAAAIKGEVESADAIIDMFVRKYGPEMFAQIREMILQETVPGAQTEGMIEGMGGGMDDMVGGMIGEQQPVAVSPGEYIVPADVVSGLGDGSSDAGAAELDAMMGRVRMARGGTTKQAPPINAQGILPA